MSCKSRSARGGRSPTTGGRAADRPRASRPRPRAAPARFSSPAAPRPRRASSARTTFIATFMLSFLMFSAQMPSTPWTAVSEGRGRRADWLGGAGWPGAYRRGAPHSRRARASSPVSFAKKARLDVRPIRAFCGRSRGCSCGRARRSGRPASRRRPRGMDRYIIRIDICWH
jgi:hypothetical protein